LNLEAAAKWWWVWALCAMQACGMKKEERRETRQDKRGRAIRVWYDNCAFDHYCISAIVHEICPTPFCVYVENMQSSVYHQNWWKN